MKKKMILEWADWLVSGKYKQGNGVLCRTADRSTRWCCLGVAADTQLDEYDWVPESNRLLDGTDWALLGDGAYGDEFCDLSNVMDVMGMSETEQGWFIRANDTDGMTFKQIAYVLYLKAAAMD